MTPRQQQFLDTIRRREREELAKSPSNSITEIDAALEGLDASVRTFRNLANHLASIDLANERPCEVCNRRGISVEQAGKTVAYVAKVIDGIERMLQFAKGDADQRTEVTGLKELLQYLKPDQFEQLNRWIEEGQAIPHASPGLPH